MHIYAACKPLKWVQADKSIITPRTNHNTITWKAYITVRLPIKWFNPLKSMGMQRVLKVQALL